MKKLTLIILAAALTLLLVNCGSSDANAGKEAQSPDSTAVQDSAGAQNKENSKKNGEKGGKDADSQRAEISAVPVEVTALTTGNISSYLLYSSTLETEQLVDIYSRIGGLVVDVYVEEGDRVVKNQKLIQIEKDEYDLAEQKARIDYETRKATFERLKTLQIEDLLSEEEFENAQFAMRQTEIAWKQAALNLEYTTARAPISGVIGDRQVRRGDRVQPTTKLLSMANLEEKIVQVYVPQNEYPNCYKNQPAMVTTDVLPGKKFKGYVKRISPVIDPQSGTFKVVVGVKDTENKLRPGMFVSAELIVDTHENARLIPKAALIYENERTYFFIVQQDTSVRVELEKGFEDAEKIEILNDISLGTPVVVLGQNGLKNGSKIRVIEERKYSWQNGPKEISTLIRRRG
jgi:membrane fusion protein (multidrug efflux system)